VKLGLVTYMIASQWDVPTLIARCTELGYRGVELRTTHAHGVELSLSAQERKEVRARFADSDVVLWGLGTICEYHAVERAEVERNIEETKAFVRLAADVGARGVKVRPNGFHEEAGIPKEKTLEQIGLAYRTCGEFARDYGVELWMEVHGRGTSDPRHMRTIVEVADHDNCFICWNTAWPIHTTRGASCSPACARRVTIALRWPRSRTVPTGNGCSPTIAPCGWSWSGSRVVG